MCAMIEKLRMFWISEAILTESKRCLSYHNRPALSPFCLWALGPRSRQRRLPEVKQPKHRRLFGLLLQGEIEDRELASGKLRLVAREDQVDPLADEFGDRHLGRLVQGFESGVLLGRDVNGRADLLAAHGRSKLPHFRRMTLRDPR